jgi:pimeloyl-ACP methyl ester carboxylesterase
MNLHLQQWGERGERVLLVHGGVTNGDATWGEQRALAERWSLLVLDRRGYFPNPPVEHEDFEIDAGDVAGLLAEWGPLHLVGHSYGGVVALLAAALHPDGVRSLAVIEPPAFGVLPDDPDVRRMAAGLRTYWAEGPSDPEAFLRGFVKLAGSSAPLPDPLPPALAQSAATLRVERFPGEAEIPLDALRAAAFPKLVVSGGHSVVFERICDAIAEGSGGRRLRIEGAAHSVQRTGRPFNDALELFWTEARTG